MLQVRFTNWCTSILLAISGKSYTWSCSSTNLKLVRTTATLVYGDMKQKIQKLLSDSCDKNSSGVPVKEDCYSKK